MRKSSADHSRWGQELMAWWRYYNELYAGDALRQPVLRVAEGDSRLGYWDQSTRTLAIAASHIRSAPWLVVLDTLRHEMAHQYVDEVLGATGEGPHGPTFRAACERLRANPGATATGAEQSPRIPPTPGADRIVSRVQKLLSLGSSPNENEAQAALNKARELLLKHNLHGTDLGAQRRFDVRWLGEVKGRHALWEQVLGSILGEFFFVGVIWTHSYNPIRLKPGTVLEICGTPENLDLAEYVHGYLDQLLHSLWREYKAHRGLRGNRERMRYFAGVLRGFEEKLRAQDTVLEQRYALVWRGDPALDAYLRHRHPHTRTGYTQGAQRTRAYQDGVDQGRRVTLRKPMRGAAEQFGGYLRG